MKDLIKRWWFWIIVLTITFIIGFTAIILLGYALINPDKNLSKLAKELQEYHENITVYQSAGKNTIIVECTFDNSEDSMAKSEKIGEIIGKHISYLSVYEKVDIDMFIENGIKTEYSIDIATAQMNEEKTETWILENSLAHHEEQKKVEELQNKQKELNSSISSLESKKESLNTEIEKLNEEVVKIKGQPKTYPAGHLTVGTDVPSGKYKIYDGKSNFVVYSLYGDLEVNIILGGSYGVKEYIYTFKSGDKIEADSSFKLIEVK